jgi:hypothetical protein
MSDYLTPALFAVPGGTVGGPVGGGNTATCVVSTTAGLPAAPKPRASAAPSFRTATTGMPIGLHRRDRRLRGMPV